MYWRREYSELRRRYGDTRHLVYFGGHGIGDELLCSTPLHELRRRQASALGVMTSYSEIFSGSPDVDSVYPVRHNDVAFLRQLGVRVSQTTYIKEQRAPDIDVPPVLPILGEMCRLCGLQGEIELRPYLWLTSEEKSAAANYRDCLAIQSSRQSASLSIANKEWRPERFQEVVTALKDRLRVVQLGLPSDPPLDGAEDLRGRTTLRESAAILFHARAFVGLVGFLMHLARSVNCPSVIVYGGREHPDQSGYICNENLYTTLPCSPCWRWNSCDFDRVCMSSIRTSDVLDAFARLTSRPRDVLPVGKLTLR